jgi:hypothetical protein
MLRTHARTQAVVGDVSTMLIHAPAVNSDRRSRPLVVKGFAVCLAAAGIFVGSMPGCSSTSARDEYQMTRNIRITPTSTDQPAASTASAPEPDEFDPSLTP